MIRVLIVDDHPVAQKGFTEVLREYFDNVEIEAVRSGKQFVENIKPRDYDLVLLAISLPDANGLDILRDIKKKRSHVPVLVISMYPEELYAIRAIRTGAHGYLTKQCEPEELVAAVKTVLSGKKYINPHFANKMVANFESYIERPAYEKLSNMEFQVMRMFGSGKTIKDIARELNLSINSIRAYRLHIMEKIGVKGMEGLIHYALKHGITEYKNG
ncbi:MAG: response regulator transcription factor [Syntrophorhabdaceae bacterium]|nr:response regulator transcription factor [Syntrophorhabdaceae bacterium]MDD4197591.1 response regulator transcription factor [Syntrophorhabdaceae bacterium]HOC46390.1 response regulator transcription factor [Syntrophorhabdaceae bacterium]